jgi:hypothetical protein
MNLPGACGPRLYSFSATLPLFASFDPALESIAISTSDPLDLGSYLITFIVTLQNYPLGPSLYKTITITIIEPTCDVTLIVTNQSPASIDYFLHVDKVKEIPFDFTETPACGLKYSISPYLSFVTLDPESRLIRV